MADDQPKQPEQPAEDEALVKRVDDMMAPGARNPKPTPPQGPYQPKKVEPTGAPPLSGVYKPKQTAKPPLVIKLADDDEDKTEAKSTVPEPDLDEPAPEEPADSTPIDDQQTDEAVDDIAAKESDTVLALEDARAARKSKALNEKPGWKARLKSLLKNKWTWVGVAVLLVIIFALPVTRYKILGLLIKKPITITVLDSKTNTPVSQAEVSLAGDVGKTDANGKVRLDAKVGSHKLLITKQYYSDLTSSYFVGFKNSAKPAVKITATGRAVPVSVTDRITGKPLANVTIKVLNTSAKTNQQGKATIVLPAKLTGAHFSASLNGYDTDQGALMVTSNMVPNNELSLIVSGQIYFLSNAKGTIDVVKSDLDGSARKTVLAGTGHESSKTTSLLASRDWRYLVLKASRDGGQPALYLIDTSNDKVTEFDNSGGDITLVGWYGHDFVYDEVKSSQSNWQTGREALKSYDADHLQLNQLDQDQAEGSASTYAYQQFGNFYIVNGAVVYSTQWNTFTSDGSAYNTAGKSDTIRAVQPNGQGKKDYENLPVDTTGFIQAQPYEPQGVYFAVSNVTNGGTSYYQYENQAVKTASIDNGTFSADYPTYLISPSGSQTFWTELRDGQNALFTGDSNAGSKKQLTSSGGYSPYGWYTNNYVLVSKGSSQLYIMSASGMSPGQKPLKITDYYKPAQTYSGYGGL